MRALLPSPDADVDLLEAYAVPPRGSGPPFVRCNMISTLDGAISLKGRSGSLGGEADRRVFQALRSRADVVLVGAGTARSERYGPARLDEGLRARRVAEGRFPVPTIAVVTASGNLEWSAPFFTDAEVRPIIFVPRATFPAVQSAAGDMADVVPAGDTRVEPRLVLDHLQRTGGPSVLLEGGPALNADFVAARLLDELCLTISPRLVAGDGPRVLAGPELPHPLELELVQLLEEDGFLFYRLVVPRRATEALAPVSSGDVARTQGTVPGR